MTDKMQELEIENKALRDKSILGQISALGDTIHLELKNLKVEQEVKHNETKLTLSQILEQARRTNGRVNKTEEEIESLKFKYQELLASSISVGNLLKEHQIKQEEESKSLKFFVFLGQFPKLVWVILGALWILASNGMIKDILDIVK
jgi:hypothetical protein